MTFHLRAAFAALALLSTAPASAALFTYNFTAGGEAGNSYGDSSTYSCTNGTCTSSSVQDSQAFTLSGSFTVDTSKLPSDGYGGPDGLYYDTYPNQDPAAQFLSGTMIKTGGSLPMSAGTGGARSYLYGYDGQAGGSSFFQAFAQGPGSTLNSQNEYREDGTLKRQYYRDDYIYFYVYDSLPDIASIDGQDIATSFAAAIGEGYAQMGFYFYEYLYDEFGNESGYNQSSAYATARITSVTAVPGAPSEVPEPAMLGLFGLGVAGLAMGRRRKA